MLLSPRLNFAVAALLAAVVPSCIAPSSESYTESLRLTPLADGKVHSNLTFIMRGPWEQEQQLGVNAIAQHHTHLPPALTSLLTHHRIAALDLTLSSGRWSPHWPTTSTPASGIELVAWLQPDEEGDEALEARRWQDFTGALGGMFCTGVTSGGAEPSRPDWGYVYEGDNDAGAELSKPYRLLLPRLAATCTESLTPFLSLLPCSSRAGLASLLNPHRLFDGEWTLLGVHFALRDGQGEVKLEVGSVQDPVRRDRLAGGLGRRDFSLHSFFDRQLSLACPVAAESKVELVVPRDSVNPFEIHPRDDMVSAQDGELEMVTWDTRRSPIEPFNARVSWPSENPFRYPHPSRLPTPPISTRRLLLGRGQERGHIGIEVVNNEQEAVEVLWIEEWPWWVRGFVGSLQAESTSSTEDASVLSLSYTPPIPRQRPTTLQASLHLPPHSTSRFLIPYQSSYLWYTEYPSDAHRGFEVPGALVILLNPSSGEEAGAGAEQLARRGARLRLHTPSTLLSLPTPDFSMPYNVIILTSTVVTLFFGSVMNKLVRGWWVVDLREEEDEGEGEVVGGEK